MVGQPPSAKPPAKGEGTRVIQTPGNSLRGPTAGGEFATLTAEHKLPADPDAPLPVDYQDSLPSDAWHLPEENQKHKERFLSDVASRLYRVPPGTKSVVIRTPPGPAQASNACGVFALTNGLLRAFGQHPAALAPLVHSAEFTEQLKSGWLTMLTLPPTLLHPGLTLEPLKEALRA